LTGRDSRAPASAPLVGKVIEGRYRIEALIGEGGMGAVYRAEQMDLRKKVAIKVLHRDMLLNAEVVARFEREAVAGGRITHPHVASAFDFGKLENGSYYLALEFVEGKSLGKLMRDHAPFTERRSLRIAWQIADALAAAHAAGVIHRDLKPENVMLLGKDPEDEFVKVLDFGIAKLRSTGDTEQPLTQLGTVFGTPEYMSPEQARGVEVDGRSDLYTLGLILYEMLGGESPFGHADVVVILARQLSMQPPPLPERISAKTRALVTKLLKKDRDERAASAVEVRDALKALLAEAPRGPAAEGPVVEIRVDSGSVALVRKGDGEEGPASGDAPTRAAPARDKDAAPASLGEPAPSTLRRGTRIALFGYAVPKRAAAVFGGLIGLVVVLSLVLWAVSGTQRKAGPDPALLAKARAVELTLLAAAAEGGDSIALAKIQSMPEADRTPPLWRALARGACGDGNSERCLFALRDALRAAPALAEDPDIVAEVRRLAKSDAHGMAALELSATALGTRGADLIYDVSSDKTLGRSSTGERARGLLQEERVKQVMSAELAATMRLYTALKSPRCGELKPLLVELAPKFDQRAVSLLSRLNERRGCGFLGLGDCYSCLRGGGELKAALEAAKSRPEPEFGEARAAPLPSGKPTPSSSAK
jgi:hypothetical protein